MLAASLMQRTRYGTQGWVSEVRLTPWDSTLCTGSALSQARQNLAAEVGIVGRQHAWISFLAACTPTAFLDCHMHVDGPGCAGNLPHAAKIICQQHAGLSSQ